MISRALVSARAAVDAETDNPYAWHNLADARRLSGDIDGALAAYERAAEIGLPGRFFWYQFGFFAALNSTGQHQRVLDLTAPLVEEVPSLAELLVERGHALRALERTEEALVAFEQALLYMPGQEDLSAAIAALRADM